MCLQLGSGDDNPRESAYPIDNRFRLYIKVKINSSIPGQWTGHVTHFVLRSDPNSRYNSQIMKFYRHSCKVKPVFNRGTHADSHHCLKLILKFVDFFPHRFSILSWFILNYHTSAQLIFAILDYRKFNLSAHEICEM